MGTITSSFDQLLVYLCHNICPHLLLHIVFQKRQNSIDAKCLVSSVKQVCYQLVQDIFFKQAYSCHFFHLFSSFLSTGQKHSVDRGFQTQKARALTTVPLPRPVRWVCNFISAFFNVHSISRVLGIKIKYVKRFFF